MSREYPKKTNESTWNPQGTFTGQTGKERESYKKGFDSSSGETTMQKRPAPLGAPAVENQPRQYTKGANPLWEKPTKQSLVPHFANGGKASGALGQTKNNPMKGAAPAGGNQMPGGPAPMTPGGGDMGAPVTAGMGMPSSGALGGMAPPVGGALPAGGGQMPGGMPEGAGKPPGYGGGPPAPGAIAAQGSQVSQVAKGGRDGGRRPHGNPTTRNLEGGDKDGFDPGLGMGGGLPGLSDITGQPGGYDPSYNPQTSADGMQSGIDMGGMGSWQDLGQDMRNQLGTGMGTPTPMTPGLTGNVGVTGFDKGMYGGGGFSTGGSFGSDAQGGYTESAPGGGWGGESHFAKGGKAAPPKPTTKSSAGSTDQFGGGGGMSFTPDTGDLWGDSTTPGGVGGATTNGGAGLGGQLGFGPNGVSSGNPYGFNPVGDLYNYSGAVRPQAPSAPSMGAPTSTITKGPNAGAIASQPSRSPSPGGGSMGGGDMASRPDYGAFNNSGYGTYDFGVNPNMAGRTFADNYGGANPNNTGGGGNSSGGGYGGSGGASGGGFGGADQESKG